MTRGQNTVTKALCTLVWILCGAGSVESALAGAINDLPLPPGARVALIHNDILHNGLPLMMATFDSEHPLEQTRSFYLRVWSEDQDTSVPGLIEVQTGQWLLISRLRGGVNTVLQLSLSNAHRSEGFVSVLPVDHLPLLSKPREATHDASLRSLSTTESTDLSGSSTVSVYRSDQRPDALMAAQIDRRLAGAWSLEYKQNHLQDIVAVMRRGTVSLEMVASVAEEGGSLLVVNEVSHEVR